MRLVSEEDQEKHQRFVAERRIEMDQTLRHCPKPRCQAVVKITNPEGNVVSKGFSFCSNV